jgi:hypothetical protein
VWKPLVRRFLLASRRAPPSQKTSGWDERAAAHLLSTMDQTDTSGKGDQVNEKQSGGDHQHDVRIAMTNDVELITNDDLQNCWDSSRRHTAFTHFAAHDEK